MIWKSVREKVKNNYRKLKVPKEVDYESVYLGLADSRELGNSGSNSPLGKDSVEHRKTKRIQ